MSRPAVALFSPRTKLLSLVVAVAVVVAAVALMTPLGQRITSVRGNLLPLARTPSSCTMALTTTLAPDPRRLCDPVDVTTTFAAACPVCPDGINVVFIQDDTPYPVWQKQVSLEVLAELQRYARQGPAVSVGVLHYNGAGVRVALRPTLYLGAAAGALTSFRVAHDPRAQFLEAARQGVNMIRDGRRLHNGAANPECEFVIFFVYTKIYMPDKGNEMIQAGRTILRVVPNLYVGCPHQNPEECTIWEPQVPRSTRFYTEDPEPGKLRGMMVQGLRDVDTKGSIKIVSLTTDQWLPKGLKLIPDSFNLAPDDTAPDGDRTKMTWNWRLPKMADPITVTFRAEPQEPGPWQSDVSNSWRDSDNRMGVRDESSVPITILNDDCSTPTPTPTQVTTPTPTKTEVPTVVASATATSTTVPTATPKPSPIYLPLLVTEKCVPEEVHADVVLVIDVSTSMRRPSRTGRTKLAATQDAAKQFVTLMSLTPDALGRRDQVGVVGFNQDAWIQAPLGTAAARIEAAIDGLTDRMAEFTRLDLALQVGAGAITNGPRRSDNLPVLVLLTDGLPNRVPVAEDGTMETTVLRQAAAAKAAGIMVYTVAIGAPTDTNPELLTACASGLDHYFYTPDPEDLAAIYQAIAHEIDCPRSSFWGQH